jgi:hypothetical protein
VGSSTIPVLCDALQEKHPLLQDVMSCFASLLKEYKGEVEEMFVADKLVSSPLPHSCRAWPRKHI